MFASLLACGKDEAGSRTRQEFCDDWGRAACSDETVSRCQATSSEACASTQTKFCLSLVPADFVDGNADACIDAVEAAYKDGDLRDEELITVLRLGSPCDTLVRGPKEENGSCTETAQCDAAGGYECVFKNAEPDGSCQIPVKQGPGADCSQPEDICEEGFYCNGENCIALKLADKACEVSRQCEAGLFCDTTSDSCKARFAVGRECGKDSECASGFCYDFEGADMACVDRIVLTRAEPVCSFFQ